jgi:hypothetical protein
MILTIKTMIKIKTVKMRTITIMEMMKLIVFMMNNKIVTN